MIKRSAMFVKEERKLLILILQLRWLITLLRENLINLWKMFCQLS